jgi:hypothetical protein
MDFKRWPEKRRENRAFIRLHDPDAAHPTTVLSG